MPRDGKTEAPAPKPGWNLGSKHHPRIIQPNAAGMVMDASKLKERLAEMRGHEKQRLVATLSCCYPRRVLQTMLGVGDSFIKTAMARNKDIIEAATLARNAMISDLAEMRVVQLLQTMDVDKIDDHRKPQAVKYLMDSIEISREMLRPRAEAAEESVAELIFRVRKRMVNPVGRPKGGKNVSQNVGHVQVREAATDVDFEEVRGANTGPDDGAGDGGSGPVAGGAHAELPGGGFEGEVAAGNVGVLGGPGDVGVEGVGSDEKGG